MLKKQAAQDVYKRQVSVTTPGASAPTQVGAIQLATFINPAGLQAKGENLYVETSASGNANTNAPGANGAGLLLSLIHI